MALEPSFEPAGPAEGVGGVRAERDAAEILETHGCNDAADKLRRLRDQKQTAADLMNPRARRAEESFRIFRNAQAAFDRLKADHARGAVMRTEEVPVPYAQAKEPGGHQRAGVTRRIRPDDELLERERKKLAKLEAEMRRDRDARHTAEQIFQGIGGVVAGCEKALQDLPRGVKLKPWTGTPPAPRKGENVGDCLARHEAACMAVATEIEMVETAPRLSSDVLAEVERQVDALADRGRVDCFAAIEGGSIQWPSLREVVQTFTSAGDAASGGVRIPDTLGLLAWICGDEIKAKLKAEIEAVSDDEPALSDEARAAKLGELADAHLLAQRHVEHFLDEMERAGMSPVRVRGIAPPAVLGIEIVTRGN